jgi:uncharacterized protein YciI
MLYIIYQEDGPDSLAIRARVKEQHFALVLGGATLAEDGATRLGSVLILSVPSLADAEAFSMNEPFRKAGLFKSVKITRMRRGQWYPENAPSSAEGN